jgi:Conjugative transposon protein TcpC
MRRTARERGLPSGATVAPVRTSGAMLRNIGRVALWGVLALLLVRGAGDVLAGDEPPPPASASRAAELSWPDDEARAFAVDFTRAYLSYSPRRPNRYARAVVPFVATEVAGSIVPRFARRDSRQVVHNAVVARAARVDDSRALVTVAATVVGREVSTRYLTVPVARDGGGGLVVYDLPSFSAPPARGRVPQAELEPLAGAEGAAVQDVLTRFFRAFLAGRSADLEYFVPAGVRIGALAQRYELAGLDSVEKVGGSSVGRTLSVLATVSARDAQSRAVYPLRYRVRLVRRDRWYVAAVNTTQKES